MRKINLKKTEITVPGTEAKSPFVYAEILATISEMAPLERGLSIGDVRKAVAVSAALQGCAEAECVLLEEDQWAYLRARVTQHNWPFAHPEIIALVDAVEQAEMVDPNKSA